MRGEPGPKPSKKNTMFTTDPRLLLSGAGVPNGTRHRHSRRLLSGIQKRETMKNRVRVREEVRVTVLCHSEQSEESHSPLVN